MSRVATEKTNWSELLSLQHLPHLALVCLGVWLHAADSLLVATMMPAIVAEIGGTALIPWSLALYELGSIVAGASSGLLAVRLGLKSPMAAAAIVFAVGCTVSAAAADMWILLVGRLLQGFGGGGLVALSFVAVTQVFPNRMTARVMAAVSALWGTSAFLGPLIGGLFVEYGTWRGGFWLFAAQAVALAAWIAIAAPRGLASSGTSADRFFPGLRLAFLSAAVFLIALSSIDVEMVRTAVLLCLGILCLVVFLRLDARSGPRRLLPKRAPAHLDRVSAGLLMIFSFAAATIAITVYGPVLMTALHGTSPLIAGYVIACSSIGWSLAAIAVSGSPERLDRHLIFAGMLVLLVSIAGFALAVPRGPVWLIAVFAVLEGAGFGMAWTFILRRARALADNDDVERVAGAIPTVHRLGYALGAAFAGLIANGMGLGTDLSSPNAEVAGSAIFLACLPIGLVGLLAAKQFLKLHPATRQSNTKV